MLEHLNGERLRRLCRRELESYLREFWEECKASYGHNPDNSYHQLFLADVARGVFDASHRHLFTKAREQVNQEPEPRRTKAEAVLNAYEHVIDDFFTHLRKSAIS